jgi:hypothetical protein
MKSLISKYSVEGRTKNGKASGQFYLTKDGVREASKEIVGTHFGYKGSKLD